MAEHTDPEVHKNLAMDAAQAKRVSLLAGHIASSSPVSETLQQHPTAAESSEEQSYCVVLPEKLRPQGPWLVRRWAAAAGGGQQSPASLAAAWIGKGSFCHRKHLSLPDRGLFLIACSEQCCLQKHAVARTAGGLFPSPKRPRAHAVRCP